MENERDTVERKNRLSTEERRREGEIDQNFVERKRKRQRYRSAGKK